MNKSIGNLVSKLSDINTAIWHKEDKARSSDDHVVAKAKRYIDSLNQQRNDLIEKIDVLISEKID